MIAGISKAITLYLAPVLALTATILSLFAFLAPTLLLHDRVALLTVSPSTTLVQPGPGQNIEGPSVFLGSLGTCLFHQIIKDSNSPSVLQALAHAATMTRPSTAHSLVYLPNTVSMLIKLAKLAH